MDRPALKPLRPIRPAPVPPEVLFADALTRGTTQHTSASPDSKLVRMSSRSSPSILAAAGLKVVADRR